MFLTKTKLIFFSKNDNFTLPVGGYGVVGIWGATVHSDNNVNVSLTVITGAKELPGKTVLTVKAEVETDKDTQAIAQVELYPPTHPSIYANYSNPFSKGPSNTAVLKGSTEITLNIYIGAYDNSVSIEELPNYVVMPSAWHVNLRTGEITADMSPYQFK